MASFKIHNKNIRDVVEFGTSNLLTDAEIFSNIAQAKKISGVTETGESSYTYPNGYIYENKDAFEGKLKRNDSILKTAYKGCRPDYSTHLGDFTAGTYYLNWFEDGEVWFSTVSQERSGVKLSTSEQKRRVFLMKFHGAGGGGGGSKWGVFVNQCGYGGGGGGFQVVAVYIKGDSGVRTFLVGNAGSRGGGAGYGSAGGMTGWLQVRSGDTNYGSFATGGGGAGGEWGGSAGSAGSYTNSEGMSLSDNYSTIRVLVCRNGASGGGAGTTNRPTSAVTANAYNPEAYSIEYSPGYSNEGRYGTGTATGCGGCGYAGRGGRSSGDATDGFGGGYSGGGSGGGKHASHNRAGGSGGSGLLQIYY